MVQLASSTRVLLVEPNVALRSAIVTLLEAAQFDVDVCETLGDAVARTSGARDPVALVAWQAMGGLLADDRRGHLVRLTSRVRVVLMVPRRWARLLEATDLSGIVAGILPKPFEADALLDAVRAATCQPVVNASASR
jgi:DNA-binding response OmpR family regulator